jgi:PhoH-like ATPase
MDEVGRNARTALRLIEELRERSDTGCASRSAARRGSCGSRATTSTRSCPAYLDPAKPDHRILAVAVALRARS